MNRIELGFIPKPILVSLSNILPSKAIPEAIVETSKYRQIMASIEEIDLIEPLSVSSVDRKSGQHLLLDGHMRLIALRELGRLEVPCLVSTDDEAYTYNNRVNRLASVQEHMMIRRAVERGVSPERLAKALCVNVRLLQQKMTLLDGICPEVIDILKDREFASEVSKILRQMKSTRQIECAELMVSANNLTVAYARALCAATPPSMLTGGKKATPAGQATQEQIAKMERESASLHATYRLAERSYGDDVLQLVLARGYVAKLIENPAVARFLEQRYPEVLAEFEVLVRTVSLDQ